VGAYEFVGRAKWRGLALVPTRCCVGHGCTLRFDPDQGMSFAIVQRGSNTSGSKRRVGEKKKGGTVGE
jgi:hypothetical protein